MKASPASLSDLTAGTRIYHFAWDMTGTVRVADDGLVSVKWDGLIVEDEISGDGPVRPDDIKVITGSAVPGIPDWVRSHRRAARQCELCGEPAVCEHHDSGNGRDEYLCGAHLNSASDRIAARGGAGGSAVSTGMSVRDLRAWQGARTLADLGELTAQWLEGTLASRPAYEPGYGPDPETAPLIPVLAALNRAGLVTTGSQPGFDGLGYDGAHWKQRAAFEAYAADRLLGWLRHCLAGTGMLIIAGKATRWRDRQDQAVAVTRTDGCDPACPTRHPDGCDYTWFGTQVPRRYIRDRRLGYGLCHRDAIRELCMARQVTVIDPEWGRRGLLWETLAVALGDRSAA